ncbi:MAG: methylenetetrahydrofolate dehydrogenase (NADP+)/methenyltetrahydrofolate cyclohydrolase [Oceanicoccus sp.]|jgi:methylenetetrahydrofolate dehydrogenase (NADP+)/methenyltetrahydrofolate cyclohydrolase
MATLLNGRTVSNSLLEDIKQDVENLNSKGVRPKLVVILVGEDPASAVYVKHKEKACAKVGMLSEKLVFPETISEKELLTEIDRLNKDESVNGLIVQVPLPPHISEDEIVKAIEPAKDVDGFHAVNLGKTALGREFEDLSPATPKGITRILEFYDIELEGMNAVVIGRSKNVGKPIAMMLLNRNATVTICHSRTKNLIEHTKKADLIIAAVGRAGFVKAEMIKPGVVVIDVGIHRKDDGKLCGDVDFDKVEKIASALTPVPGGVGPMTVAALLENTILATKNQHNL